MLYYNYFSKHLYHKVIMTASYLLNILSFSSLDMG